MKVAGARRYLRAAASSIFCFFSNKMPSTLIENMIDHSSNTGGYIRAVINRNNPPREEIWLVGASC